MVERAAGPRPSPKGGKRKFQLRPLNGRSKRWRASGPSAECNHGTRDKGLIGHRGCRRRQRSPARRGSVGRRCGWVGAAGGDTPGPCSARTIHMAFCRNDRAAVAGCCRSTTAGSDPEMLPTRRRPRGPRRSRQSAGAVHEWVATRRPKVLLSHPETSPPPRRHDLLLVTIQRKKHHLRSQLTSSVVC